MKYLIWVTALLMSATVFAGPAEQAAQLTKKRLELERISTDLQKTSERLQQEIDLIQEKVQEAKNSQTKSRLKLLNVEQELKSFVESRDLDSRTKVISQSQTELERLHSGFTEFVNNFSKHTYMKTAWQDMREDLEILYRRKQVAAYQVKLSQLLEKMVFDANQMDYSFETAKLNGNTETVEMIRLGHWMNLAKTPQGLWKYTPDAGFVKVNESTSAIIESIVPQVKARALSFVPQDIVDLKANEMTK